ncbi:unnamed protein product [Caenorhabditis bovis]|uniref:RING-type E3 ubiquitin transferase n=1 Tax=Caenorhabditis bovis TaxID=2654633 RepID=A0A8S1F042_9PELO|nr:unnamed protein product [Caenorhabditis bovis]
MSNSTPVCRYFANGACDMGDSCRYSHDRSSVNSQICQFYAIGRCSFGNRCRFDHRKPNSQSPRPTTSSSRPTTSTGAATPRVVKPPTPAAIPKPGLNVQAPEFIPSWKKNTVNSYAAAAGASNSAEYLEQKRLENLALCPYFEKSGECPRSETCVFAHGDLCDMCNTWCMHPFSMDKRNEHFKECSSNHEKAMEMAFMEQQSLEKSCGICMELIFESELRFGILPGCKHCFCLSCIREWRSKHETSDLDESVVRSCPECRQHSDYVIPSVLWVEGEQEKKVLIEIYKENLKRKVCKYYNGSERGVCPFGNKCFYKHQLPDGSIDPGESPRARRRARIADFLDIDDEDFDYISDLLDRFLIE